MSTALNLVALNDQPEPVAARVRRLQTEARQLARSHVEAFTAALAQAQHRAIGQRQRNLVVVGVAKQLELAHRVARCTKGANSLHRLFDPLNRVIIQ